MMDRLKPVLRLPAFLSFVVLGAFVTLVATLASPSDPKNSFLFGYSLERIVLGLGLLVIAIALLFLTRKLVRDTERSLRLWNDFAASNAALLVSFFLFAICWIVLFLPPYRIGGLAGYVSRLTPIIIWLAVVGLVSTVFLILERKTFSRLATQNNRVVLRIALIVFGIFILFGSVVWLTGIGYLQAEDYWYGAGVPVLGLQILFSLFAGGVFIWVETKRKDLGRYDLLIFIIFWIISAVLWAREPLSPNYFMPDTADNPIYPYSDGATFDQGSQFALIGQGLFNDIYFDRVLYSVFLTYLHMLVGQDLVNLLAIQAAVFAVFPGLVYLVGRELHSRALGISAGVLMTLRGINAIIAAKWIDTASPKMMLTDFPTAIGIALFLLFLLKWLKEPSKPSNMIWAGAAFGLTLMVRTHVLTLLPVFIALIPFLIRLRWKQFALVVSLLLLGMLTVTFPWEIRNQSKDIPMFYMYYSRIELLLRYRYGIGEDARLPQPVSNEVVHAGDRQRIVKMADEDPVCGSLPCSILNHFFHNGITSIVSLPSTFSYDDIWNTVKADTPYWQKNWTDGTIGVAAATLLVINLSLISLGTGSIWTRSRSLTLLPILIFVAYLFTNSIGLTSGGRYVAPVDWIVYLFFMAGGLQLVTWLMEMGGIVPEAEAMKSEKVSLPSLNLQMVRVALPSLTLILAVGMLLPVSEMPFSPRYQVRQPEEMLSNLEATGLLQQTGFSREELMAFLSQPSAMIREGRALYPRYYPAGEGEQDRSTYYRYLDYQRLVFTLIGPYSAGNEGVVIPGFAPSISYHTEDVIVLGCWNTTYYAPFIDAVVVIATSGEGYVYSRDPGAPLQCPLPEPKP